MATAQHVEILPAAPASRPEHLASASDDNPARDAHAKNVYPSLREIEQLRIEHRPDDAFSNNGEAAPCRYAGRGEKPPVCDPHADEDDDADDTELDPDRQDLV